MNLVTEFKKIINSELEKRGLKLVLDYSDPMAEYFEYYPEGDECEDEFFDAGIFEFRVEDEDGYAKIFRFKFAMDDEHEFYKLRIRDIEEYRFSECLFESDEDPQEWYIDIENSELHLTFVEGCEEKQFEVIDFDFYPSECDSEDANCEITNCENAEIDEEDIERMRKKPRWAWTANEYEIYSKLISQNKNDSVREQHASARYKLSVNFDNKIKFHRFYNSYDVARVVLEKEINQKPQAAWKSDNEVIVYTIFNEPIRIKIEEVKESIC